MSRRRGRVVVALYRTPSAAALVVMLACTGKPPPQPVPEPAGEVTVRHDPGLQETHYTITEGDCTISWTLFRTEINRGGIRHRSDCGLSLGGQAPLIGRLLRKVMASEVDAARLRTLGWGRLYPDGARDTTMPERLALAAMRSPEWDAARGRHRGGDVNGWVRKLADEALIYGELRPVFRESGLEIQAADVEKVLVMPAGRLKFFDKLRQGGIRERDRVPFDCQIWFSLRPAGGIRR